MKNKMTESLVERLKNGALEAGYHGYEGTVLQEAAATITRLEAEVVRLREALQLARFICHDAFKDTCMEWDAQSMAVIDAALQPDQGET